MTLRIRMILTRIIVAGLFLHSSIILDAQDFNLDEYDTVGEAAEYFWERIESGDGLEFLPHIDELMKWQTLSPNRIGHLDMETAWQEAHAMAGVQSAYFEDIRNYPEEFTYITAIQLRTRSNVIRWALVDETMKEEGWIPVLIHQLSDELVGLAWTYNAISGSLSTSDKRLLAETMSGSGMEFAENLEPVVLQSLMMLIPVILDNENDEGVKSVFNDFLTVVREEFSDKPNSE